MSKSLIKDLTKVMEFPKEGIFSKVLVKTDNSNYTLMCLAKGSDISEHTSTREAAVTVLKGKGIFILNGKKIKSGKYNLSLDSMFDPDFSEPETAKKIEAERNKFLTNLGLQNK